MDTAITPAAQAATDELTARFGCSLDRTEEQDKQRMNAVKGLARRARKDPAACGQVERLLKYAAMLEPDKARTFRAFYLDGANRINSRQLAARLYVSPKTILMHNKRIFELMCDFW